MALQAWLILGFLPLSAETSGLPVWKAVAESSPLFSLPPYSPKVAKGAGQIQETFLATPKELLIYLLAAISLFYPSKNADPVP